MKKYYRIRDRFNENDHGGLRGEVIFGTGKHIVEFTDPYGNKSFYTEFDKILYKKHNIVPIGGYQFAFDKLFNIGLDQESTLRVGDLNDEAPQMKIGVNHGEYISTSYDTEISTKDGSLIPNQGINISAMNFIFGFMMGDGGAKEDNITAIASDYKRRTLYRAVPFRMSNDGGAIDETKYFGKSEIVKGVNSETITSYYVKRFDTPAPRIVHVWADNNNKESNIVDDTVFASTSSTPIESFVEMNLSVSETDGRGFFTYTNSSSRINEFALVSGWYNSAKNDYESIRMFTHFTRPSIALAEGDSIEVIYRLYAR